MSLSANSEKRYLWDSLGMGISEALYPRRVDFFIVLLNLKDVVVGSGRQWVCPLVGLSVEISA